MVRLPRMAIPLSLHLKASDPGNPRHTRVVFVLFRFFCFLFPFASLHATDWCTAHRQQFREQKKIMKKLMSTCNGGLTSIPSKEARLTNGCEASAHPKRDGYYR